MAKAAFASILDQPASEEDQPRPTPVGSYLAAIAGHEIDKTPDKGTEYVEFNFQLLEALDDVDEESLEEYGSVTGKTLRARYFITDKAIFMLNNLLDHAKAGNKKDSRRQRLEETTGKELVIYVRHEAYQGRVRARVVRTAPAK